MTGQKNDNDNATRSRVGRPKIPADQARNQRIVTFVTTNEYLALSNLCSKRKQSMSALCDQILSEYLSKH